MRLTQRVTAALAFCLLTSGALWAQSDAFRKARALFEQRDYVAAEQALKAVERDKLNDAERMDLDSLTTNLPEALAGSRRAEQDRLDADRAANAGRWDEAERLYRAVIGNPYAKAEWQSSARQALDRRAGASTTTPNSTGSGAYTVRDASGATTGSTPAAQSTSPAPPPAPAAPSGAADSPTAAAPPPPQTGRLTVVEEMRVREELLWQRAVAKLAALTNEARQALSDGRYEDARQLAEQGIHVIESHRQYAEPVARYEAARADAEALKIEVATAFESYERDRATTERDEIAERVRVRRELIEKQRAEKIDQLFNTATQLRKEQRFDEMADVLREVVRIDPANARAKDWLEIAEDYASFAAQSQLHADMQRQMQRSMTEATEALVPWTYDILYPRNWQELSAKREGQTVGVVGRPDEDRELNRKLSEVLPDVRFEEQPFETVVEFLADLKKVNIAVDWEDLSAAGIERDKAVTVKLNELTFQTVMNEILTQVGGDVTLAFNIADGLLRIATKEKLDKDKAVLVYDIRDLLVNIPRFTNAPRLDPAQALNSLGQGGAGGGGGGGSSQLFQTDEQEEEQQEGEGNAQVEQIMDIIRQTVEPDSWRETGGGDGSLRELNGQLIVYNTSDAHRQISDLLSQLRETRALQIAIETRFLTVQSNFLEEIGVDLDFVFNSGSAGFDRAFTPNGVPLFDPFTGGAVLVPRQFSRIGSTPATPGFGQPITQTPIGQPFRQAGFVPSGTGIPPQFSDVTPIPVGQNSINLTDPGQFNTGVPGSLGSAASAAPALNIAGSFLDNLQVDFLIRATQANARSSVVQAPRLLMFNGQRANVTIGRARQYVSSVTPQLAEGVAAVQPVINTANSGTSLDVEGTISADRKYVTVTVRTTQSKEPRFERFQVQQQSGSSPGIFVTLVDQEFATINTTVSIPDGGTVLLGGLKQVGEIEVDAGVPILSKVPILKRAFTNTTTIKDTQTLLILIKAKIIIQKEAEEEAFPALRSATAG